MFVAICHSSNYFEDSDLWAEGKTITMSGASRRSFLKTTVIGGAAATLTPLYPALGRHARSATPAPNA